MSTPFFRRSVEVFWFWLYPAIVLLVVYRYFLLQQQPALGWLMILAPALTMYVVVGTGAGLLRFWYFTTRYSPRGVMPTIGLLYSAVLNPFALGLLDLLPDNPLLFAGGVAGGGAVLGTLVDVFLLQARLLHVKARNYPVGSNAVRHALSYGPAFFGLVGFVNGLGMTVGYNRLTVNATALLSTLGLVVPCCALPFLVFLAIQKRRQMRHRRASEKAANSNSVDKTSQYASPQNPNRPMQKLIEIKQAVEPDQLAAYQALVREVFVDQLQYDLLVDDVYLTHSLVYIWVINQQIAGGVRIVLPSENGLPVESMTPLPDWMRGQVVIEFSRLVMHRQFRRNLTPEDRMGIFATVISEVEKRIEADYIVIETIEALTEFYEKMDLIRIDKSFVDPSLAGEERAVLMYRKL